MEDSWLFGYRAVWSSIADILGLTRDDAFHQASSSALLKGLELLYQHFLGGQSGLVAGIFKVATGHMQPMYDVLRTVRYRYRPYDFAVLLTPIGISFFFAARTA